MVRSLVFKNEGNGPWVVRPITYIVQLIYSPLLLLADYLTDLCKYIPSNPQHCWHGCVLPSLHLKRIQLLQQIHWCKSFRSPCFLSHQ